VSASPTIPAERRNAVIDLTDGPTPNGRRIRIARAEMDLPSRVTPVHIGRGERLEPAVEG